MARLVERYVLELFLLRPEMCSLTFAESQLRLRGDHRRIEVVASSFTIVSWLLPSTNRITLMHEGTAKAMLPKLPLANCPSTYLPCARWCNSTARRKRTADATC